MKIKCFRRKIRATSSLSQVSTSAKVMVRRGEKTSVLGRAYQLGDLAHVNSATQFCLALF